MKQIEWFVSHRYKKLNQFQYQNGPSSLALHALKEIRQFQVSSVPRRVVSRGFLEKWIIIVAVIGSFM